MPDPRVAGWTRWLYLAGYGAGFTPLWRFQHLDSVPKLLECWMLLSTSRCKVGFSYVEARNMLQGPQVLPHQVQTLTDSVLGPLLTRWRLDQSSLSIRGELLVPQYTIGFN